MGKALLKSKTFWTNAIIFTVAVSSQLVEMDINASPETVSYLAAAAAIGNIVLRLVTKEPILSIK